MIAMSSSGALSWQDSTLPATSTVHSCTATRDRQTPLRKRGTLASFLHSYGSISADGQARGYGSPRPGQVDVDPPQYTSFLRRLRVDQASPMGKK